MVTYYIINLSPATTKREGPRINSLVCHSLILVETLRDRSEEVGPLYTASPAIYSQYARAESNRMNQSGAKVGAEWGAVNNVRFFLSSQGLIRPYDSDLGSSVYSVFVQGLEAVGCVYQDNFSARILYRGPEFSDALYQNVTIGYTMSEVTRVLNDLWISQMLCTLNS